MRTMVEKGYQLLVHNITSEHPDITFEPIGRAALFKSWEEIEELISELKGTATKTWGPYNEV